MVHQRDSIVLAQPGVIGLSDVVDALRDWQFDGAPIQLHPGDLGWRWSFGAKETADAVWTWSRDGEILAVGLLDSPGLVRMAIAPGAQHDEVLARAMVADVTQPGRGVLPPGDVSIEARSGELFRRLLFDSGWEDGEPWTPLQRNLADPVEECGLRVEVAGPELATAWVAVQRAAFVRSTFTIERWTAMVGGPAYVDARSLVGFDEQHRAVAAVTVWSAGEGRPGLLEPMGVHHDHRGHGFGRAITVAAASALRGMGSSSATVCTRSANVAGVDTYKSAGFRQLLDVADLHRRT